MVDKWIRKYMKMAKALADDNRSCYSRKIGCVLIDPDNCPIGFGYNGSIEGAPHNDDERYLAHLWKNLLDDSQKEHLTKKFKLKPAELPNFIDSSRDYCDPIGEGFVAKFEGCKTCPRRLLDVPSGVGLELCNCSHAERNAIFNAAKRGASTKGATIYCWCGVPCHECSIAIIQSKIKRVVCLETGLPDYSKSSRGNFRFAGVELVIVNADEVLADNA